MEATIGKWAQIKEQVLDTMQAHGYGVETAIKYWNEMVAEIKELPAGKYTYSCYNVEIKFTK